MVVVVVKTQEAYQGSLEVEEAENYLPTVRLLVLVEVVGY